MEEKKIINHGSWALDSKPREFSILEDELAEHFLANLSKDERENLLNEINIILDEAQSKKDEYARFTAGTITNDGWELSNTYLTLGRAALFRKVAIKRGFSLNGVSDNVYRIDQSDNREPVRELICSVSLDNSKKSEYLYHGTLTSLERTAGCLMEGVFFENAQAKSDIPGILNFGSLPDNNIGAVLTFIKVSSFLRELENRIDKFEIKIVNDRQIKIVREGNVKGLPNLLNTILNKFNKEYPNKEKFYGIKM